MGEKNKKKEGFFFYFKKNKLAMLALILLTIEVITVLLLPRIMNLDPYTSDMKAFNRAPSAEHLLGTDDIGRDCLARLLYGGRVSLMVGVCSLMISLAIGIPLGLIAGYYRGWAETIIMRLADIFMSFPSMVLILVLVAVFGASINTVIGVIGVLGWTGIAKLIYGNVLSCRSKEYIEAAKTIGMSNKAIILKHILPNCITPVWVAMPFMISSAIVTEAALSFLGMGVQSPQASWGNIINAAQKYVVLTSRPWIWIPAGIVLIITVIIINLIGEGIRDAFDPKMNR
ncbi:MAG: ABC transporter permease [Eubacteriales bacterium]|nr:ABC transporter permease [Eubacteriales bacterium]